MEVGVQLPEVERDVRWPEYRAMARATEEVGLASIWLGDHLLYRVDSGIRAAFRFTTLAEAEHTLERVANMIVERERSELQQAEIQEERDACKRRGDPTESWPELPPLRGLSVATGKAIISTINAFIISRASRTSSRRRGAPMTSRLGSTNAVVG
jgi:hypothetical protein